MARGVPGGNSGTQKQRFSTLLRGRSLRSTWEQKMAARSQRQSLKMRERGLKEAREQERERRRQRRQENISRRLQNERRSEVVQVVTNPQKIKRLKKKQLRQIEKRDTLKVGQSYAPGGGDVGTQAVAGSSDHIDPPAAPNSRGRICSGDPLGSGRDAKVSLDFRGARKASGTPSLTTTTYCPVVNAVFSQERELDAEEVEEISKAFMEFDRDRDGYISYKDVGHCMRTMGYMATEMELLEITQKIKLQFGGRVDLDDFVQLMTPRLLKETAHMVGVKELKCAFKELDKDGDGIICRSELELGITQMLGEKLSSEEIQEVLRDIDLNADGQVDFDEFVMMLCTR